MAHIHFKALVDQEQIIRPPQGIILPVGEIEVTVRPAEAIPGNSDPLAPTRNWLLALAEEAEQAEPPLPCDLAEHHDHP